jgi:hypothetical protein
MRVVMMTAVRRRLSGRLRQALERVSANFDYHSEQQGIPGDESASALRFAHLLKPTTMLRV